MVALFQMTYDKLMVLDEVREMKYDRNSCYLSPDEERIVETGADMTRRVLRFKETLRELASTYKNILVVCHFGTIWYMTGKSSQEIIEDTTGRMRPNGMRPENCQVIKYEL